MYDSKAVKIHSLIEKNLKNLCGGNLIFSMSGLKVSVDNLDIMGGVLQSWIKSYLKNEHNVDLYSNPKTQEFPDFFLNKNLVGMLELKCFDANESPNFDLANFDKYLRALIQPGNCDIKADFLVLGYSYLDSKINISEVYLKKIWEMAGPSQTNILNLQVKQGKPVNIRPKNFRKSNVGTFKSEDDFIAALDAANTRFNREPRGSWSKRFYKSRK
jgi:hypothetical protein